MLGRGVTAVLVVVSTTALSVPATPRATSPTPPATSVGFDISYPQCGHRYPATPGFGVVGVNRGHDFSTNPCLASELRWVGHAANAAPAFYVNTGAPGPRDPHWPRRQNSPRRCRGANSTWCSYDYGWNSARASFASVLRVFLDDSTPLPRVTARSARWWLDVEVANPWEYWLAGYGPSRHSHLVDQAAILGSLAYLRSAGVAFVGIYSSVPMWHAIMGSSGSTFAGVPDWIPGSASLVEAVRNCATSSFTGGFVAMTQYPSSGYDGDYQCALGLARATASLTVPGSALFHGQLGVAASVGPVTFTPSTGAPAISVSPTGAVTTSGALARGTYTAAGTTRDTGGDSGAFSVVLLVGYITQTAPTAMSVTVPGTVGLSEQLVVSGGAAPIAFAQSSGLPALIVSATGLLTTSGPLAAGTYSASGTTGDPYGDGGTFHFTVSVGQLVQLAPTSAIVSSDESAGLSVQLAATGNVGPVTFTQASGQPVLLVSPTGVVTTSGPLGAGTYKATGTMRDPSGDVGTFAFSLKVTPSTTTTTTTPAPTTTTTVASTG